MSTTDNFTKIFGIPGSGKTERLLTEIEKRVEIDGIPLNRICYTTFTRSAAKNAKERITVKFNLNKDQEKGLFFGTTHSLCLRLLKWNLSHNDDDGEDDEEKLCLETPYDRLKYLKRYGLTYPIDVGYQSDIPENILSETDVIDKTDEEKIFGVINWCNHRCVLLDNWRSSGIEFNSINPSRVLDICEGWQEYKHRQKLVDFDDMLLKALENKLVPYADVLVVDEFQDQTPLLHSIFKLWSSHVKEVIVAGDDDQTIYMWAGATPNFLLNINAKTEVLGYSHRVPENVLLKAKNIIETVKSRQYKEYKALKPGGHFVHLISPFFDDLLKYMAPDKSIYFLFRTNYLAQKFCIEHLIPEGIPFLPLGIRSPIPNIWTHNLFEFRDAFVRMHQNKPLQRMHVSRLLRTLPSCSRGKQDGYVYYGKKTWFKKKSKKKDWSVDDLFKELFVELPLWNSQQILSHLGDLQIKSYLANIQNKHWNLNPYDIKVGTIHAVKGLEGKIVFVFNNHTSKIENEILDEGQLVIDNEKRLYYVAVTRTIETCILIDNFFDTFVFDLGDV